MLRSRPSRWHATRVALRLRSNRDWSITLENCHWTDKLTPYTYKYNDKVCIRPAAVMQIITNSKLDYISAFITLANIIKYAYKDLHLYLIMTAINVWVSSIQQILSVYQTFYTLIVYWLPVWRHWKWVFSFYILNKGSQKRLRIICQLYLFPAVSAVHCYLRSFPSVPSYSVITMLLESCLMSTCLCTVI